MATRLVNTHSNQSLPPVQARGSALSWRVAMALRLLLLPVKHRLCRPLYSANDSALTQLVHPLTHTHTCTRLFSGKLAVHSRCNTGPISFPLIVAPKQLWGEPWLLALSFHLGTGGNGKQQQQHMSAGFLLLFFSLSLSLSSFFV